MLLSRHSVGIYQETNSQAFHQETLGYSRLSSLSHCGLILAERVEFERANFHFKKKAQAGNELSNILPKSSHARKKPPSSR